MTRLLGLLLLIGVVGCGGDPIADKSQQPPRPANNPANHDLQRNSEKQLPTEETTTSPPDAITTAKLQLQEIAEALNRYQIDMRGYPDTSLGLAVLREAPQEISYGSKWLGPYLEKDLPLDPWGKPYFYDLGFDGRNGQPFFTIWSTGPNKLDDGGGDDVSERSNGKWLDLSANRESAAQIHLQALANALQLYHTDLGTYPAKEIGLQALKERPPSANVLDAGWSQEWAGPYLRKSLPQDPFGTDYQYDVKQDENDKETFSLWSVGADGKNGTADDIIQKPIPGYAETLAAALTKGDSKELLALGVTQHVLGRQIHLDALKQLQEFRKALDLYQLDMKSYPNTTAGLGALLKQPEGVEGSAWKGPYLKEPLSLDPWGNKYFYELRVDANKRQSFRIRSIGPNLQNGDEDDIVLRSDGPQSVFSTMDKESVAHLHLQALAKGLELYRMDLGTYPAKEMGLYALKKLPLFKTDAETLGQKWAGPYLRWSIPLDPYGRNYYYDIRREESGKENFTVWSIGADGKPGTADDILQKPIPGYAKTLSVAITKGDSKELLALGVTPSYLFKQRRLAARKDNVSTNGSDAVANSGGTTDVEAQGTVDLSYSKIPAGKLATLNQLEGLRVLKLDTTDIGNDGLNQLKGAATLESLGLANTQVTDEGLAYLKNLTTLRILDLGYTQVTDAGLAHLQELTRLENLALPLTKITDSGMSQLKGMNSLVMLDIRLTQITDTGLEYLHELTNLKGLNLAANEITDAGLKHLQKLDDLEDLALGGTKITDSGLALLAGFKRLKHLGLDGTKISDVGLARLAGLTNLQSLSLKRTMVTETGIAELQKTLPDCKISH